MPQCKQLLEAAPPSVKHKFLRPFGESVSTVAEAWKAVNDSLASGRGVLNQVLVELKMRDEGVQSPSPLSLAALDQHLTTLFSMVVNLTSARDL